MNLKEMRTHWAAMMKVLSRAAGSDDGVPLEEKIKALTFAREVGKDLSPDDKSGVVALVKNAVVAAVKAGGYVKDGKVSTYLDVGQWNVSMHPYRTGIDPKKMLARLIAKKRNPKQFMKEVPTYEYDQDGFDKAMKLKVFTKEDLADMQYDESWVVKTPKFEEEM